MNQFKLLNLLKRWEVDMTNFNQNWAKSHKIIWERERLISFYRLYLPEPSVSISATNLFISSFLGSNPRARKAIYKQQKNTQ